MDTRLAPSLLAAFFIALAAPASAQTSSGTAGSPEAAPGLIARGDTVFHGAGNCYACHGSKGEGVVGPNLTDAEWIHSKGSYEDIVKQIHEGIPKEKAKSGIPMPPKGGSTISEADIKAVAAYVYSLSHKPGS